MLQWFGILDTWGFIKIHPFMTLGIIAGYFLIGTLWGIIKWIVYVKNQVDEIKEKFRLYCEYTKIPEDASSWNAYKQSSRISLDPPRISSHKEVFFGWILFWPLSFIYTILNDTIRKICNKIYNLMASKLQAISNRIYKMNLPKGATETDEK
jgi:hypothetical protein